MLRKIIAAAGIALALHGANASAATLLRVMGFGGSSNWPLFVAQDKGFFARAGLEVKLLVAPDSATQMKALAAGDIDIATTAMDNVIAQDSDVFAFLGVNSGGRYRLLAPAQVAEVAALEGRTLAVDALASGYAFVLQEMLREAGLSPGDYQLASVGGGRARWQALQEGKVAGALLNAPYDATAEAAGFRVLADSRSLARRYQGSVGAARREWARAHEETLVSFIRAYVAAVDWLFDPANAKEAQEVLRHHIERLKPEEAARSYRELLDPESGSLARRAAIDLEGVRTVLGLRARYATPARNWGGPEKYYDARYYDKALNSPALPRS